MGASLQTSDEPHDPVGVLARLPDGYPATLAPADGSRLGRMMGRLAAALETDEVARAVSPGLRAELIALVPRLRRYAASLTWDPVEADDLVQSTLLKAWESREHLPEGPPLAVWLFAVLRRSDLSGRRRSRAERSPEHDHGAGAGVPPERDAVRAAVDRLTRTQREALLLVTVEGLSREAAAAILDCPVESVRERLDQAHERLARDLGSV